MAANQNSFDGQQFRNQVAYAFKNCSTYTPPPSFQPMPKQFQQQMEMAPYMCVPQMYGSMAQMEWLRGELQYDYVIFFPTRFYVFLQDF